MKVDGSLLTTQKLLFHPGEPIFVKGDSQDGINVKLFHCVKPLDHRSAWSNFLVKDFREKLEIRHGFFLCEVGPCSYL